jgi:hypothetical protein
MALATRFDRSSTDSVSSRIRLFERFIPDDAYLDEGFVLPISAVKADYER